MAIKFIKAGLQTTVQDLGRIGYRQLGIAANGSLDAYSHQLANWLLGNPVQLPCLEVTQIGPVIECMSDVTIAITGAKFELSLNGIPVQHNQSFSLKKGDTLHFGKLLSGARAYIALAGKINIQKVLSSYSTNLLANFGGFDGRAIKDGDVLEMISSRKEAPQSLPDNIMLEPDVALNNNHFVIRVTTGREFEQLTEDSKKCLFETEYSINSLSNRMAIKTEGEMLKVEKNISMTTVPIATGTVQLPPHGQPIITLADGQTTGGYPRIAQVITADLSLLAQVKANETLSFYPVTIEQANQALIRKNTFIASNLN